MMKTVKPYRIKEVLPKDFFNISQSTREELSSEFIDKKMSSMKRLVENMEFFEKDGVIFFPNFISSHNITSLRLLATFQIDASPGARSIKNDSVDDGRSKRKRLWKFGFLDRENNTIFYMFDGRTVASTSDVKKVFDIAEDLVNKRFQPNTKHRLLPLHKQYNLLVINKL